MPPTNHSKYATRSLLSRSRVDWAIEAARRVRAEPVGALGEAGLTVWVGWEETRDPCSPGTAALSQTQTDLESRRSIKKLSEGMAVPRARSLASDEERRVA